MEVRMISLKKGFQLIFDTIIINLRTIIFYGCLGFLLSLIIVFIPIYDTYEANSAVCSMNFRDSYDGSINARLIGSYMDTFSIPSVQTKIVDILDNSVSGAELKSMTKMKTGTAGTILNITVRHTNPELAIKAANAVALVIIMETDRLYKTPSGIEILDIASSAHYAFKGNRIKLMTAILITFFSLLGSCTYYAFIALTSDKILFIEDCTMDGTLEIMGVIPYSVNEKKEEAE
jgi:capsular polysaccharide biosynthesis protein